MSAAMMPTAELRAAMKWWRAANPQYTDAKVRVDGWAGRAVFATHHYETKLIATVSDVLRDYRAALAEAGA